MSNADKLSSFEYAAEVLSALSHPIRLTAMEILVQREVAFRDLMIATGLRQAALSHQHGILRQLGLASARSQGQHTFYRCDDEKIRKLLPIILAAFGEEDDTASRRDPSLQIGLEG